MTTPLPRKLVKLLQDWDRQRVELEQLMLDDVEPDVSKLDELHALLTSCLDELRAALDVAPGDLRYVPAPRRLDVVVVMC